MYIGPMARGGVERVTDYVIQAAPETEAPPRARRSRVERDRATGRDVILAVVENMRQSLEPLVTETYPSNAPAMCASGARSPDAPTDPLHGTTG